MDQRVRETEEQGPANDHVPEELRTIAAGLERLARGDATGLTAFLHAVEQHVSLDECRSVFHCHVVSLDGNGRVRLGDLMRYLADNLLDYAIPRGTIREAFAEYQRTSSTAKIQALARQAKGLFANVANTGEGGELLLFLLAEQILKLGSSLPTVSRMLSSLERELGVRLIARNTHGLTLTDGGRLYYQRCSRILDEIGEADSAVQSHSKVPSGELRITAPVTFGRYHVAPYLAQFLEQHPKVSFYLLLTDHCEPLSEQRLDLAVRVAVLHDPNLTAVRLGYIQRTVVGSPEYFKKHPIPVHPRELSEHNCMHFSHYLRADEWSFQDEGRPISVRVRGRMRANNQEALMDATLAGAGLAVLPMWLVKQIVGEGRLRRVLGEFERPRTPVHAVLPNRGPPPSKVRAFIEFLSARYKELGILSPEGLGSEAR